MLVDSVVVADVDLSGIDGLGSTHRRHHDERIPRLSTGVADAPRMEAVRLAAGAVRGGASAPQLTAMVYGVPDVREE